MVIVILCKVMVDWKREEEDQARVYIVGQDSQVARIKLDWREGQLKQNDAIF